MYYTVIKHSDHLGTLEKCRKHSPATRVFYISLVFSNARRVLSQYNTRLRLLYLLNNVTFKKFRRHLGLERHQGIKNLIQKRSETDKITRFWLESSIKSTISLRH